MAIPRPAATLALSAGVSGEFSMAQAGAARLRVDFSVDETHDRVEVRLWKDSKFAGAEAGAVLTVGLGNGDDLSDVIAVEVVGVDLRPECAVLIGYASSLKMSYTFIGKQYLDQSAGDIASDLMSEAEVDAGEIDSSVRLPAYHVDPRRDAWANLHRLANVTGSQITTASSGALNFAAIPGSAGGIMGAAAAVSALIGGGGGLREGAELLDFQAGPRAPRTAVEVTTPSGGQGSAWHLWAASPDGGSVATLVHPALRTRESADGFAAALTAQATRAHTTIRATVVGQAQLRAGDVVQVRDTSARILSARHVLDATRGHTCELVLEGSGQ